jgi:hypothetical protein
MAIITTADLASYLRDISVAADESAALYVDMANGLVEDVTGMLDPIPTRVKAITLEVAARAWRNPNGYSSETVDDYTYRRDADTRAAGVYLTESERMELQGVGVPLAGFYSVDLGTPAP